MLALALAVPLGFFAPTASAGACSSAPEARITSPMNGALVLSVNGVAWTVHICDIDHLTLTLADASNVVMASTGNVGGLCPTGHGNLSGFLTGITPPPPYVGTATMTLTAVQCGAGSTVTHAVTFTLVLA